MDTYIRKQCLVERMSNMHIMCVLQTFPCVIISYKLHDNQAQGHISFLSPFPIPSIFCRLPLFCFTDIYECFQSVTWSIIFLPLLQFTNFFWLRACVIVPCRRHVWANFCLAYNNEKLINDSSLLSDYGIRNNSKVSSTLLVLLLSLIRYDLFTFRDLSRMSLHISLWGWHGNVVSFWSFLCHKNRCDFLVFSIWLLSYCGIIISHHSSYNIWSYIEHNLTEITPWMGGQILSLVVDLNSIFFNYHRGLSPGGRKKCQKWDYHEPERTQLTG